MRAHMKIGLAPSFFVGLLGNSRLKAIESQGEVADLASRAESAQKSRDNDREFTVNEKHERGADEKEPC